MNNVKKQRDTDIDATKGILIILVVIGHIFADINTQFVPYIYLFHMPAFFIISGLLYNDLKIKKRFVKFILPFVVYTIIFYFFGKFLLYDTPIKDIIIGGNSLGGLFGVFWFPVCLFFTTILFGLLEKINCNKIIKWFIIALLYVTNVIILKSYSYDKIVLWNFDILFICLTYYSIGYYSKSIIKNKKVILFSSVMAIVITLLWYYNLIEIVFNMKGKMLFNNMIIQVVFPFCITICLINLFARLFKNNSVIKKSMAYVGKSSLLIMYLHIIIFTTLRYYTNFGYILQIIISIILPLIFNHLISKIKYLKLVFGG